MIKCPVCGTTTKVIDSRLCENIPVRTRWCLNCLNSFYTEEIMLDEADAVKKLHNYRSELYKSIREKSNGYKIRRDNEKCQQEI